MKIALSILIALLFAKIGVRLLFTDRADFLAGLSGCIFFRSRRSAWPDWTPTGSDPDRSWSALRFNFILVMSLGISLLVCLELQKHFSADQIKPVTEQVSLRKLLSVGD